MPGIEIISILKAVKNILMKVAFITRSTLYTIPGGDTVQITQTARHLAARGVEVDILLTGTVINYAGYDLLHFFNITRPADILYHIRLSKKPFVVSTIFIDYSEYDKYHRKGLSGFLFRFFPVDVIEYLKTVARWVLKKDKLISKVLLWKGQRRCINEILGRASVLLPNSFSEYDRLVRRFGQQVRYFVVPNGINPQLFSFDYQVKKDSYLVICAARIEGIKNQLNLIKALNNTKYRLLLIGDAAPNQKSYYEKCKRIACQNIEFIGNIPQTELIKYYQRAGIHVLPSWFETTGLSSLEAAVMGCRIVVTDKGDTREYFGNDAFYCDPSSPQSIYESIVKASSFPEDSAFQYDFHLKQDSNNKYTYFKKHNTGLLYNTDPDNTTAGCCNPVRKNKLQKKILAQYTWQQATIITLHAYELVIKTYDTKYRNFRNPRHTQQLWWI
jgi:glycosyltransferase involved in cell wall biosynthesis